MILWVYKEKIWKGITVQIDRLVSFNLESSGSNDEHNGGEEKNNEGDGSASHAIIVCLQGTVPVNQDLWK